MINCFFLYIKKILWGLSCVETTETTEREAVENINIKYTILNAVQGTDSVQSTLGPMSRTLAGTAQKLFVQVPITSMKILQYPDPYMSL